MGLGRSCVSGEWPDAKRRPCETEAAAPAVRVAPGVNYPGATSEMESDGRRQCTRCYVVRPAKGRKKVIQRFSIRQIDHGQPHAPLISISFEDIIVANRDVEQIARRDARGVVVVILSTGGGNADQSR